MISSYGIQKKFYAKRVKRRRIRLFLSLLLLCTIAGAGISVPFFSGLFDMRTLSVTGTKVLSSQDVQNRVLAYVAEFKANLLWFSSDHTEELLAQAFPRIASVDVSKNIFTRTVAVSVVEREPAGIACEIGDSGRCFSFDRDGVFFAEAPRIEGASLLKVAEQSLADVVLPRHQYSGELVAFMTQIKKEAHDRAGVTLASFSVRSEFGDIEAKAVEGFTVFFTMTQDAAVQTHILKNILVTEIKDQAPQLDYIDLRVENRAYYKLRE